MARGLQLGDIPPELLGKISGHVAIPDMLRLKLVGLVASFPCDSTYMNLRKVNRNFRYVISNHPHLQYKCGLAAAGLLDNLNAPATVFERRTSLRRYCSIFYDLQSAVRSNFHLGAVGDDWSCRASGNTFVLQIGNCLHFYQPASALGSRSMKMWSFPLTFPAKAYTIHPKLDLIVIEVLR